MSLPDIHRRSFLTGALIASPGLARSRPYARLRDAIRAYRVASEAEKRVGREYDRVGASWDGNPASPVARRIEQLRLRFEDLYPVACKARRSVEAIMAELGLTACRVDGQVYAMVNVESDDDLHLITGVLQTVR